MIEKNVKLYLGDGFPVRIPVSQYDTMWRFIFTIINGSVEWTIPTGATAVLNGRKPDGNVIAISGTIADNKVTVDATEQMTVVAGEVVCELSIMSGGKVIGTANFILAVEDAPKKDGEPISESDLSAYAEMIAAAGELVEEAQEIIEQGPFLPPGGTPGQVLTKTATGEEWGDVSGLPDGGNNGQVLTKTSDGATWSDAGTPTQAQTNAALADYLDEHPEAVTTLPNAIKSALLACFQNVAWANENGQTYYNELQAVLYGGSVVSISAVYAPGTAVIYDLDSIEKLRNYLTVTAHLDSGTDVEVTDYELSGSLTVGTSTITVTYDEKTTTFNATVTESGKWLYHFNNSLVSSGNKDFGLSATTPNYTTGKIGNAITVASGTKNNVVTAFGVDSSNVPTLDGDFTIAWWGKQNSTVGTTMFRLARWDADEYTYTDQSKYTLYNGHTLFATAGANKKYHGIACSVVLASNYWYPFFTMFDVDGAVYALDADRTVENRLTKNTWYHFACCRKNGVITWYINGLKWASVPTTAQIYAPNQIVFGGSLDSTNTAAGVSAPTGAVPFIDEWLLIDGVALYDDEFTPPTTPCSF